ncbi:MAG: NAD(P)/FAD-dependent oxidoreductase, partial [Planctomycetota bacterium]
MAIVGTGAAGLFAAIWAGRAAQEAGTPLRIVAFDGARRLGAKILVAGGGRCNVTHWRVDDSDYAGSTPPAIRNVLRRFGVEPTIQFFSELGVELKREDTGKLFPVTDDAHSVLNALLAAARDSGVQLSYPNRVTSITASATGFRLATTGGTGDS